MTDPVNLQDDFLLETPIPGLPLESILRTQELRESPIAFARLRDGEPSTCGTGQRAS